MTRASTLIRAARIEDSPYWRQPGAQTSVQRLASPEEADRLWPDGLPEYIGVHWCEETPYGWYVVFGWFEANGDGGPLRPSPPARKRGRPRKSARANL